MNVVYRNAPAEPVTKDGLFSGFETQSYSEESGIFANWRLDRLYP